MIETLSSLNSPSTILWSKEQPHLKPPKKGISRHFFIHLTGCFLQNLDGAHLDVVKVPIINFIKGIIGLSSPLYYFRHSLDKTALRFEVFVSSEMVVKKHKSKWVDLHPSREQLHSYIALYTYNDDIHVCRANLVYKHL